jgi:hypothetical protein
MPQRECLSQAPQGTRQNSPSLKLLNFRMNAPFCVSRFKYRQDKGFPTHSETQETTHLLRSNFHRPSEMRGAGRLLPSRSPTTPLASSSLPEAHQEPKPSCVQTKARSIACPTKRITHSVAELVPNVGAPQHKLDCWAIRFQGRCGRVDDRCRFDRARTQISG